MIFKKNWIKEDQMEINMPFEEKSGMIFTDQWLDDDIVQILETIVDNHVTRNYKEVRNIIFGYDSKNNVWISKYGKGLDKKLSNYLDNSIPHPNTENFIKPGMMFYEDEIYNNIRFHVDESVKRILDLLFTYSDKVVEYRHIIDIIISEWNLKNIKNNIIPTDINTNSEICGDLYFYQLEVRESAWKELKSLSKYNRLMLRDAFKQAVIGFLENRAEMLKNNKEQIKI